MRDGASPREWAAFTGVGDPLVRVLLRQPWGERDWRMVGVLALVAGEAGLV